MTGLAMCANAIEHAFILCRNDVIRAEELPSSLVADQMPLRLPGGTTLKEIERSAIIQMLRSHKGKRMEVARALGIDKNTLRRKMIRLQIG